MRMLLGADRLCAEMLDSAEDRVVDAVNHWRALVASDPRLPRAARANLDRAGVTMLAAVLVELGKHHPIDAV